MPNDDSDWIIPASIPFEDLKGKDLEECVYWLLEAMGAQDIEWRVGGSGGGAPDGGRDLEAKILVTGEDGDLSPKTWWFECKGRKGTVEPEAVKNAAINAMAFSEVDALVVVTNSTFSNPTVDWVKAWNASGKRPSLQLWDRSKLEQQISRQPSVVLRLFSESLSLPGRLAAMSSRFWNRLEYVPSKVLEDVWVGRDTVALGSMERFALIANECAGRSIENRPWGAVASAGEVLETLQIALVNIIYIFFRVKSAGTNQEPIFRALTYLILVALQRSSVDQVAQLIRVSACEYNDKPLPDELVEIFLGPILSNLMAELSDICVPDCRRVSRLRRPEMTADGDNLRTYWYRFKPEGLPVSEDEGMFWLEHKATPCEVGFTANEEQGCPLTSLRDLPQKLEQVLSVAQRVSAYRMQLAEEKAGSAGAKRIR